MFFHLGAEEFCERLDRVGKSRRPPQLKVVFKYLDAVLLVVVVDDVDLNFGLSYNSVRGGTIPTGLVGFRIHVPTIHSQSGVHRTHVQGGLHPRPIDRAQSSYI